MSYLMKQDIITLTEYTLSGERDIRYCDVRFTAGVWASNGSVWLMVTDGATTTNGAVHSGSGTYEDLSVIHTISEDATELTAAVYMSEGNESATVSVASASFAIINYKRDVTGGCPSCGSYTYDPTRPLIKV